MGLVYVVTSGEYSSYGINAVFDDEELAKAYVEKHSMPGVYNEEMTIEYYVLNEEEGVRAPWYVEILRDGRVLDASWNQPRIARTVDDGYTYDDAYGKDSGARFTIWASSKEQAIKAANERRAMLIALGVWGKRGIVPPFEAKEERV